ncbi:MAG: uracil-DNA glycosylase [Rhodospirillaceae bacterium]|nr:uracil-DNA glycosylase [Rhodospirillaceae bacterium]MCA8933310.1 uracil-DNA glycosylase [Rhodospirillaceae bacterium]
MGPAAGSAAGPTGDCPLCPRLAAFRAANRAAYPDFFNAPVPSFGELSARLLVVGLAPGLRGANRTGRPFTGDGAGEVLYPALQAAGFAKGTYGADPADGFRLVDARITNAVRCVPPENKPTGAEAVACRPFLAAEIAAMPNLAAVLCLGLVSHKQVLAALGRRQAAVPFRHGEAYDLGGFRLYDSYHCSRYNMNTGRLTTAMFAEVFGRIAADLR